mgnify:CR=1 FL=1
MNITYVLVAVTGVEDEAAAIAAIDNLNNDEQQFNAFTTMTTTFDRVEEAGDPVIYFP